MAELFVTEEEFADLLGVDDITGDPVALLALEAACQAVRTYLDRQVNALEDEVTRVDGSGTDVLLLPQWPVTEVASVFIDDEELVEVDEDDDVNWRFGRSGMLFRLDGYVWPRGHENIEVTYSTGWPVDEYDDPSEVPADIRLVTLLVARRTYTNRGSTGGEKKSETIGNYSYTLADAEAALGALTKYEMGALDRYVRRPVRSG